MVKRRKSTKRRVVGGKRGYKKCMLTKLRGIKFTTPKAARRAFSRAAKICKKKLCITSPRVGKRKVRRGRKKARHCKYGHRKGSKRCRKHPVKRRR